MELGGPPEGAPAVIADPMDVTIIDKVCSESNWPDDNIVSSSTFCDHPKKINNKLLFLTVEYVDDQARDFDRMYPSYEQVSFSSNPNSPLSDFEHCVSPLDPNMSSAARYSPTPVPLPSSPFHNSVTVLQERSSPLISTSEPAVQITNGYSAQLTDQSSTPSMSQSDNSEDFTDSTSDGLVSSVGNELMLIQGSGSELEESPPLMLAEISGSDLSLTRDFLVMQEDQINVINSIKLNSNLESNVTEVTETILPHDINEENTAQISSMKNLKKILEQSEQITESVKKDIYWCKDQSNEDSSLWYEDCDSTCTDAADCTLHSVCTIADQPVPSRAVATLPGLYLSIDKLPVSEQVNGLTEFGIFAKKNIRRRTQFGPIEGILHPYNGSQIEGLPLLLEITKDNGFLQIDVSDENASNWMRFVRPAQTYEEQNLVICQQNDAIIFLTTRNINPSEELKAGPSLEYGKRRNLPVLEVNYRNSLADSNTMFCTQSHIMTGPIEIPDEKFTKNIITEHFRSNSTRKRNSTHRSTFQKYLEINENDDNDLINSNTITNNSKGIIKIYQQEKEKENAPDSKLELMKQEITQSDEVHIYDNTANVVSSSIYKCTVCSESFSNNLKFQQHCLIHIKDDESLSCNVCFKTFMNNSSLSRHLKIHQKEKRSFECPICREAFGRVLTLKDFSETHLNQDEMFTCPHCPKSFNSYALTRKHARAHHFDQKHECQFCLKSFPAADKLRMHLLKHSDRREFQCANCGKQFKRKDKLKDHVTRVHYTQKTNKDQISNNRAKKPIPKTSPVDCDRFIYKCRRCQVGFKRRGMLVNHLAKRHPDVPPESVPELSLPILRQTRDYYCQYCEKVYKSSSKRKAHIMKNHPGAALPPSNRNKEFDIPGLPNPTFSQAAGSIKTIPQGCQWCHKQYASKAKLLQHQRKKHSSLMEPADQVPRPRSRPPQNQNHPPTSTNVGMNKSNVMIEGSETCDEGEEGEFLKPRIVRVSGATGESLSVNNGFELLNSQFARVRDMR